MPNGHLVWKSLLKGGNWSSLPKKECHKRLSPLIFVFIVAHLLLFVFNATPHGPFL